MQNKQDLTKELEKTGTVGQESVVFILLEENGQSEPIRTLPLTEKPLSGSTNRAR